MTAMIFFSGALITVPINARAESDTDVIDISFEFSDDVKDGEGYLSSDSSSTAELKYKVTLEGSPLSKSSFEEENGVFVNENAGKVVFTFAEDQDTCVTAGNDSVDMSEMYILSGAYDEFIKIGDGYTVDAEAFGDTECSNNEFYYIDGEPAFHFNDDIWDLDPYLSICFKDGEGNSYEAKYSYELRGIGYIVPQLSDPSKKFIVTNGKKNYTEKVEGNVYTIIGDNGTYWSYFDGNMTFTPRYAYGASGVNANENGSFTTDGTQVTEGGYHFQVKNGEGKIKDYILKVEMPFALDYKGFADYIANIYDNDVAQSVNGETLYTLKAEDTISVAINLPEGKELSNVELHLSNANGSVVPAELNTEKDGFSFKMPRGKVILTKLDFAVDASPRYRIETAVSVKNSQEDAKGCFVLAQANGTAAAESIRKGTKITLTAKTDGIGSDSRLYDYKFDHWENVDVLNLTEEEKKNGEITFMMPESNLSVTAVYVHDGTKLKVGSSHRNGGTIQLAGEKIGYKDIILTNNEEGGVLEDYYHPAIYQIVLKNYTPEAYALKGWLDKNGNLYDTTAELDGVTWEERVDTKGNSYIYPKVDLTVAKDMTFIASFEPKTACTLTVESNDSTMGSATASLGETAITAGTTLYDGQTITLKAVPNSAKYIFKEWKLTKPESGVTVTFANPESAETTFVMPAVSGGQMTIQAVFIENPNYQSEECTLSDVELLKSDGTLVKKANKETVDNVTTFTVQLSPKEMTKDETAKLTSNAYKLRLTYSNKATAKKDGGYGDNDGADKWSDGIFNPISVGSSGTFIITAQNTKFKQEYTIAIAYDDRPLLTAGAVNRISDTEATVDFTSSSAGSYYYAVVEKGAAEPKIDTDGVGVAVKANKAVTISLKSLTAGAKDIYIKVKNDDKADDVKISKPLKITIPDYDPDKTGYTISLSQSPGGTISVDKELAKEGEIVTVTVTPDAGKKIKPDGLRYSQSGPPYEVVKIDTTTKQFQMPAYNISVSCTFVDADTVTTDGPTIGAFIVNGVSGVINDTTGTITITLPYGTDLTALKPALTLKGAVSVSPASGATVNLSSPVTYTVTAEDGTTKTYTVTAYTEAQPVSDKLWEDMLNHIGGNTSNTGKNTWWQKAKDMKKNNNYPKYW